MTPLSSGHRLLQTKIARLKDQLEKEQERHHDLLRELEQIKIMEKSIMSQKDKQDITKIKRQIAKMKFL